MRFNHLHAPFNNVEIRRAVLSVVNQTEYMTAMNGADFPEYWSDRCGVFVPGSPMDSDAGMEKLTGKRDIEKARAAIKAAGYNGEKVVLLDPVDFPTWHAAALVTADLFKRLGFNVDLQTMDWGTAVQRRNNQEPVSAGGWSVAFTGNTGPNNLIRPATCPCAATASRPGSAGPPASAWSSCASTGSTRPTWTRRRRSAARSSCKCSRTCRTFRWAPPIRSRPCASEWKDFQPQMSLFYTLHKA